jgi:hypothetical protein
MNKKNCYRIRQQFSKGVTPNCLQKRQQIGSQERPAQIGIGDPFCFACLSDFASRACSAASSTFSHSIQNPAVM